VLALLTRHMITTLILLDAGSALRACLGIGQYPVGRLRFVSTLLVPSGEKLTDEGCVGFLAAFEAEGCGADVASSDDGGVGEL